MRVSVRKSSPFPLVVSRGLAPKPLEPVGRASHESSLPGRSGRVVARASLLAAAAALLACGAPETPVREAAAPTSCAGPYPCVPMQTPPPLGGYPPQPVGSAFPVAPATVPRELCTPDALAAAPSTMRPLLEQACANLPAPVGSSAPAPSASAPPPASSAPNHP